MVEPGTPLPGDAALVILPGLEGDHRRSRRASAKPAWTSTSSRICGAAARCSGSAAAIRCWAAPSRSGRHRGRGRLGRGLGLLDVETVLRGDKRLERVDGATVRRRAIRRLRDAYGRDRGARSRAAPSPSSATARQTARCRRTAASPAPTSMACSPTTASAGLARAARRHGDAAIAYDALGRGDARRARRPSRGAYRYRQACSR